MIGRMGRIGGGFVGLSVLLFVVASNRGVVQARGSAEDWSTDYRFGGCGGAYFLAEPGEFWVEIEKADLNTRGRRTHLRAILVGPDRRVLDEQWLPDDGREKGSGMGPVQRVRLSTTVDRKGIYGLNVTVTEDRYGDCIAWGFKTNCPRYLVETSRGHRDARHEEPLVLRNPDAPGDVCFRPTPGSFAVEVTGLKEGFEALTVFDGEGNVVASMPVGKDGKASHRFAADGHRGAAPWRLHLPRFWGTVQIDEVTRWGQREGGFANLSLWTPEVASWFSFHENRWLLTPYSRVAYGEAGAEGVIELRVHNNGTSGKKVALGLEFPEDTVWPVELATKEIALTPGQSLPVSVRYRVPSEGEVWISHVRATPADDSGVSTYSTLEVRRGVTPTTKPFTIPLVLKPYEHENKQFGYLPEYPVTREPYFDMKNRPVISDNDGIALWRDGEWVKAGSATLPDGKTAPFRPRTSKVAFDRDNEVYTIAINGDSNHLLRGTRGEGGSAILGGNKWLLSPFIGIGGGSFDIEQFSGHNVPDGPPPFVRIIRTAKDPKLMWRSLCDLALFVPEKSQDGTITIDDPILVSKKCLGISSHSGIPSSIVSRGAKVHVAWGEATEPEEDVPGVPTFVATYDRETGALSEPALVGYGPPANDVHNTPCITMDSKGFLHVLIGTHGRTFKYARSLAPNDSAGGWTEAEDIGPGLRQTYIGLVCDQEDTLHVVFRLWRTDNDYFPASSYATLAYMRKRAGEPWSEPRVLIVAPFSEYSIFYHRLTIDRAGRLFLSYDYWSTFWFYRTDHFGSRRALMMSPDGGETWKMAELGDLVR